MVVVRGYAPTPRERPGALAAALAGVAAEVLGGGAAGAEAAVGELRHARCARRTLALLGSEEASRVVVYQRGEGEEEGLVVRVQGRLEGVVTREGGLQWRACRGGRRGGLVEVSLGVINEGAGEEEEEEGEGEEEEEEGEEEEEEGGGGGEEEELRTEDGWEVGDGEY